MDVSMSRDKNVKGLALTKHSAPGRGSSDCGCCDS